nr:homeobox protein notochord [Odocoileus virginianus texanus]
MPSPGPRGCRPLPLSGAGVQPPRSSRSPVPATPALPRGSANPSPPRAPGRLESSFSVEAILARPDPCAPTASPLPVSAGAHGDLWNVPARPPAQALPGACPPTWLPARLSAGLHQRCPQPPALRPFASHFCGLQGLSITALDGAGIPPARPTQLEKQLLLVPFSQSEELLDVSRPGYSLHCSPLYGRGLQLTFPPANCSAGLELVHCLGLWDPQDWAHAQDLQDTERSPKRIRTVFNLEQLEELEKVFAKQHNIVGKKRAQLAAQLNLTENQVRVWFQNRRVKYQKQQRLKMPATSAMAASPDEPSSSSDTSIQREDAESGMDS